jgi:transcriptional regulator with XRE-family HTH domain
LGLVIFVRSIVRTNVQTSFEFPNNFGKYIFMERIAQRLYDYFFKHKGFKNDTVVANELGYSHPEKISRLFRTGTAAKPSVDILEDVANKFGNELSIEWILTGKGQMLKEAEGMVAGENVARNVRAIRINEGLTSRAFAKKYSLGIEQLAQIETGILPAPGKLVAKLCKPLGYSVDQFKNRALNWYPLEDPDFKTELQIADEDSVYNEKSGTLQVPDIHLLTRVKQQIKELQTSLQTLDEILPLHVDPGTTDPGYEGVKTLRAGKKAKPE